MCLDNPISSIGKQLNTGLREIHKETVGLQSKTNEQLNIALTEIDTKIKGLETELRTLGKEISNQPKEIKKINAKFVVEKKKELKDLIKAQKNLIGLKNEVQKQTSATIVKLAEKAVAHLNMLRHKIGDVGGEKIRQARDNLEYALSHAKFKVSDLKKELSKSGKPIVAKGFPETAAKTSNKTDGLFSKLKAGKKELKKTIETTEQAVTKLTNLTKKGKTFSEKNIDEAITYSGQILALQDENEAYDAITANHEKNLESLGRGLIPKRKPWTPEDNKPGSLERRKEAHLIEVYRGTQPLITPKYQPKLEEAYQEALKNPTRSGDNYNAKAKAIIEAAQSELTDLVNTVPLAYPEMSMQATYFTDIGKIAVNIKGRNNAVKNAPPEYTAIVQKAEERFQEKYEALKAKYAIDPANEQGNDPANTIAKEQQLLKELKDALKEYDVTTYNCYSILNTYNEEIGRLDRILQHGDSRIDRSYDYEKFKTGLGKLKEEFTSAFKELMDPEKMTADLQISRSFKEKIKLIKTESFEELFEKDIQETRAFLTSMLQEALGEKDPELRAKMLEQLHAAEMNFNTKKREIDRQIQPITIGSIFSKDYTNDAKGRTEFRNDVEMEVQRDRRESAKPKMKEVIAQAKTALDQLDRMKVEELVPALKAAGQPRIDSGLRQIIQEQVSDWQRKLDHGWWRERAPKSEEIQKQSDALKTKITEYLGAIEGAIKNQKVNEERIEHVKESIGKAITLAKANLQILENEHIGGMRKLIVTDRNQGYKDYMDYLRRTIQSYEEIQQYDKFARVSPQDIEDFLKTTNIHTNIHLVNAGSKVKV